MTTTMQAEKIRKRYAFLLIINFHTCDWSTTIQFVGKVRYECTHVNNSTSLEKLNTPYHTRPCRGPVFYPYYPCNLMSLPSLVKPEARPGPAHLVNSWGKCGQPTSWKGEASSGRVSPLHPLHLTSRIIRHEKSSSLQNY
jgi:hypothetical protein